MTPNPYKSPQQSETRRQPAPNGMELAKDTVKLLVIGLLVSIVAIPILFILFAFGYGIFQYFGLSLPNP